jgi:hypothetical protein
MGVQLYNKGKRSFVINKKHVIEGGSLCTDGTAKDKVWFRPDSFIVVADKEAARLAKMYPKEIRNMTADAKEVLKKKPARKKPAPKSKEQEAV